MLDPGPARAHRLAEKILEGKIETGMTVRDLKGRGWSKLTHADLVASGLAVLESRGWLRVEERETGGRPSPVIVLRPDLEDQRQNLTDKTRKSPPTSEDLALSSVLRVESELPQSKSSQLGISDTWECIT